MQNVQEQMAQDSTVNCSGRSKVLSSQDSVALNNSSRYAESESTEDEHKHVASVMSNDPAVSSENIAQFQLEAAIVKSNSEPRNEQVNDREEGEWSDKDDTIEPSGKTEVDSWAGNDAGTSSNRPFVESKAKEAVEKCIEDSSIFEGGFDVNTVKMEVDKKSVLDSNKSKELDNDIKCEESTNVGKPDDIHVSTKPSSSDKSYEDDSKKNVTNDGLDDVKGEASTGSLQLNSSFKSVGLSVLNKPKGVKGQHESKFPSCLGNKRKVDEQTEAKLGKKRSRQTVFLNLEDVKRAGPIKTQTSKRQSSVQSPSTHLSRENHRSSHASPDGSIDKQGLINNKDQRQADSSSSEGGTVPEIQDLKRTDYMSEDSSAVQISNTEKTLRGNAVLWSKRVNCNSETTVEGLPPPIPRQTSWKQGLEQKHGKGQQLLNQKLSIVSGPARDPLDQRPAGKKHLSVSKKQGLGNAPYQDTSIERLHREVTSEKFWHHPGEMELQCVPGRFESAEGYVRVFEPLLFEECRAQLYSTWEELCDVVTRDAYSMVRVKSVDRRERGWYDVTVIPTHEYKFSFKEGDVAVLSTPKPGPGRFRRISSGNTGDLEATGGDLTARVAGTVRKYSPIDTRDPDGAIVHFYVGDSFDHSSKANDDHILMKLQKNAAWYLTVLGSLATTQREYVALHAFRRLNTQMQRAILDPSPEHFPKYEEQPPAMPECFTSNFTEHLHRTFNTPQLAAIQWAAMHTAAGTNGVGSARRQEPWPFTLVQGPPGTGKTHTVWGMLNVIHLVQYQHYYGALLKKLAPESYRQASDNLSSFGGTGTGSIEDVLQNMDQNLFPMLHKLCPKPRMLVCAPSNAATDELLQRVLDRGFIDGEMKIYRPDVARVGVDSQNRAAQAVSVERRADHLLLKGREEVIGHMQQLRAREGHLAQQIIALRRDLSATAAAGRSQGTVGVDPEVLVARDQSRDAMLQNLAAVVEERDKVLVELSRLFILESRFRPGGKFVMEEARANLEASFANEAEIVFTTVSSSGRKLFQRLAHGFDMVVIDEAAQASEVAVLPPLSLGAARCVLVGDPQQLPATVISQAAGTLQYSRSLFERFQQAGCPTMLLSVQYRMHPQIRDFPSRYFYQNRLSDSESVVKRPDEIYYKDPLLKPYIFYDITHGRESHRGGSVSYQNIHEAQFALQLYEHLQKFVKSAGIKVSVGIITPYKLQLKCLQREFESVLSTEEGKGLYINTVDAFQGQERDVIIMSCVRASGHGVGFVADIRRMNVALTRARRGLWVMGNAAALKQSNDWSALIDDAKARGCYMDMDSLPRDFFPSRHSSFASSQARPLPPNMRTLRLGGSNQRQPDIFADSTGLRQSDENLNVIARNGSYRNSRGHSEYPSEEFGASSEKSKDVWQPLVRPDRAAPEEPRGTSIRSDRNVGKYA